MFSFLLMHVGEAQVFLKKYCVHFVIYPLPLRSRFSPDNSLLDPTCLNSLWPCKTPGLKFLSLVVWLLLSIVWPCWAFNT